MHASVPSSLIDYCVLPCLYSFLIDRLILFSIIVQVILIIRTNGSIVSQPVEPPCSWFQYIWRHQYYVFASGLFNLQSLNFSAYI